MTVLVEEKMRERAGEAALTDALDAAQSLLADALTTLHTGTPDADELSEAVCGTHRVITTLADVVEAVLEHAPTIAEGHGPDVGKELAADLRALHGRLTSGALLLAPALDDLAQRPTN
ncbi:MAG TPA: hypothetical protein VFV67_17020 [Actinophytocola sp.]|uniref:hypothetical protein n=1 Tax=Actinophytocola sp. TaxID=1872138 RepID=UPI002DBB5C14|nr:hypothetical protein [Actinophytocola sp.]HEU5472356.1 hypothetical protein [Actinophytocola sp.]